MARTTKKAAAKPQKTSTFPLEEGHYFSVPVGSRRSVSSGGDVQSLRNRLGMDSGLDYDTDVAAAVGVAQESAGIPVTRVVDAQTWDAIFD